MAVTTVLTGTSQSVTATNGSATLGVTATSGWWVGATIQGTGIPAGARVGSVVVNTSVTMVTATGAAAPFTGTTGAVNVLVSSKFGTTLTVSMSAATDTATPATIYANGFGVMETGNAQREIYFPGGLNVTWSNIVAGAVFDFESWTLEFGSGGLWQFDGATILGELRGGYLVNGTQFLKTVGPTFYANNWNNSIAGGSNMWLNSNSGTTQTGIFRMHNPRFFEVAGSNASPYFSAGRMQMVVENMILDYQKDSAGANAAVGAAYGTMKNIYLVKTNGGISAPNGTNFATITGLQYVGNYQSSPQYKFSIPDGYTLDGYAPQVLSTQLLGGSAANRTETYSNIDLSSAGWGLNDLKTKYQRYGGPNTLNFSRTVSLAFKDSTATALTGVTLYVTSGSNTLVNAVQAGDYSALLNGLSLVWTTTTTSYRTYDSLTDTIAQTAQIRKYGYIQQSTSYSLNTAAYSQPFFMLTDTSLAGISSATAAAITTAGINWSTKTITPTGNLTLDQINARIAYELAQTTGSAYVDPRTISGTKLTLATGWTLVVNSGITISAGTNIQTVYVPTITNNGSITALYSTTAGTSGVITLTTPVGSSVLVTDNNGATTYIASSTGTNVFTVTPGQTGFYTFKVGKRGFKPQTSTETITGGGVFTDSFTLLPDTDVVNTTTDYLGTPTLLSTAQTIYDALAQYAVTNAGMAVDFTGVSKSFGAIDFGALNVVQAGVASNTFTYSSGTLTIYSVSLASDTYYSTGNFTQTGSPNLNSAVKIRFANLNSEIIFTVDSVATYPTMTDRDNNTNAGLVLTGSVYRYLYGATISGVVFATTLYSRVTQGTTTVLASIPLATGTSNYTLDTAAGILALNSEVAAIATNLNTINLNVMDASILVPANRTVS